MEREREVAVTLVRMAAALLEGAGEAATATSLRKLVIRLLPEDRPRPGD